MAISILKNIFALPDSLIFIAWSCDENLKDFLIEGWITILILLYLVYFTPLYKFIAIFYFFHFYAKTPHIHVLNISSLAFSYDS